MLGGLLLFFLFVKPASKMAGPFFETLPTAFYLSNFAENSTILFFTWSLATEEQFYLFWPPIEKWLRRSVVPGAPDWGDLRQSAPQLRPAPGPGRRVAAAPEHLADHVHADLFRGPAGPRPARRPWLSSDRVVAGASLGLAGALRCAGPGLQQPARRPDGLAPAHDPGRDDLAAGLLRDPRGQLAEPPARLPPDPADRRDQLRDDLYHEFAAARGPGGGRPPRPNPARPLLPAHDGPDDRGRRAELPVLRDAVLATQGSAAPRLENAGCARTRGGISAVSFEPAGSLARS